MRSAGLAGGLLVLLLGAGIVVIPSLARDRDTLTTTPQPRPLSVLALVELPGSARACLDRASMDEHSERALIRVGTHGGPPSALRLEIAGPGVHEAVAVPPTYADGSVVSVPVDPPRDPVVARVCIRNQGHRKVALYASADRYSSYAGSLRYSRSETRVDGRPVRGNFELAFAEGGDRALAARMPEAVERMQGFRPGAPWLTWIVGVLFLVGVPAGAVWAFAASYPRRR
jgi:hypothetical protein